MCRSWSVGCVMSDGNVAFSKYGRELHVRHIHRQSVLCDGEAAEVALAEVVEIRYVSRIREGKARAAQICLDFPVYLLLDGFTRAEAFCTMPRAIETARRLTSE